jgi:endonuclease/exonuclease/phosphatase family metal-dependent hydrolase
VADRVAAWYLWPVIAIDHVLVSRTSPRCAPTPSTSEDTDHLGLVAELDRR